MDNKPKNLHKIMYWKSPEFFSPILSFIISGINWVSCFYMIFSFIIYTFYHFFALETLQTSQTVYSATDSMLLKNSFNSILLCLIAIFGFITMIKQTIGSFYVYMVTFIFFISSYLLGYNITFIPTNISLGYTLYSLFNIFTFAAFSILAVYSGLFYFKAIGYFKYNLNDIPMDDIIHEVKLRSDLAKMNFNGLMMKLGVHKITKKCLFGPDDYYFTNMNKDREDPNNIKKEFGVDDSNKSMSSGKTMTYATAENSYMKLDCDEH